MVKRFKTSATKGQNVKRITSPRMTPELAATIKALLAKGYQQHEVAGMLKLNQGRVSEVNTGKLYPHVKPGQIPSQGTLDL